MKKFKQLSWMLVALTAFFLTSCENEPLSGQFVQPDDPTNAEIGQLKAQVDGDEYLTSNVSGILETGNNNYFTITAIDDVGRNIVIGVDNASVATFNLTQGAGLLNGASYFLSTSATNPYTTDGALQGTGQLSLTELDTTTLTASGTFSFIGKRPALDANGDPVIDGNGDPVIETVTVSNGVFNMIPFTIDDTGGGGSGGGGGGSPIDEFYALTDGDEFVDNEITTTLTTVGTVDMIKIVATTASNALMRIDIPRELGVGTYAMESEISDGTNLIGLYNSNTGGENLTSDPGTLTITNHDTVEGILEATFSFTARDPLGGDPTVVEITEGSFIVNFEGIPGSGVSPFSAEIDGILYEADAVNVIPSTFSGVDVITIDTSFETQNLRLTFPADITVGTHIMDSNISTGQEKVGYYVPEVGTSISYNSNPGTLEIISFDMVTGEMEGTFTFTAVDPAGVDPTIYEITVGQFTVTVPVP